MDSVNNNTSNFIDAAINLYKSNFDQEKGEIILPEVFSKVLSLDGDVVPVINTNA